MTDKEPERVTVVYDDDTALVVVFRCDLNKATVLMKLRAREEGWVNGIEGLGFAETHITEMTDEPITREEWLANNREICIAEGEDPETIFVNQIETRLALAPEIRNEDDERLGDAYVACLANYEGQGDQEWDHEHGEGPAWAPFTVDELVSDHKVSRLEATVIIQLADAEYSNRS